MSESRKYSNKSTIKSRPRYTPKRTTVDLGDTRSESAGEWLYSHRVGLLVVLVIFMLSSVVLATAHYDVDIAPVEYIIEFVEEDPYLVNFRLKALPMMEYGYQYIPCASVDCRCVYNSKEIMEYFKKYANDDQILGYITAPWVMTVDNEKTRVYFEETFRLFREAREQVYGE